MPDGIEHERQRIWEKFDPNDPNVQILLLSREMDALKRREEAVEKREDELEKRIAKMENSFQRGAGILMVLPIVGTLVGILFAYGKLIFKPWTGTP
jgi:hypothetical protein